MQISPVNLYNKISFGKYSVYYDKRPKEITVDDLLRKEGDPPNPYKTTREYIREAYADPYLVKKIKDKDFESIDLYETYRRKNIPLPVKKINKNCYRGETLLYTPKRLTALKHKGVKNVIDLANVEDYDILCDLKGFKYYNFPLFLDYRKHPPFVTREQYRQKHQIPDTHLPDDSEEFAYDNEARRFIDDFKELVNVINQGNFYISCDHGRIRTDAALLMNQYFNPKWDGDKSLQPDAEQIVKFKIFYNNLSNRDKRDLGFTEDFDKDLRRKLAISR